MSRPVFELPRELEAAAPPPTRDGVRLLVARRSGVHHERFRDFAQFLAAGDLLVVNLSATLAAAVDATRGDGRAAAVHFSTDLGNGRWVIEVRPPRRATGPVPDAVAGERIVLAGGLELELIEPYPRQQDRPRLWSAAIDVTVDVPAYLARFGAPIRYAYVPERQALDSYQSVFARYPGSAEMPSAARPFTADIVIDLIARGVLIAAVTLHAGVSSQEAGEPPLPERFDVPATTARLVESTRAAGGRVVAVGTTVTRALESAVSRDGAVRARRGWTDLVLGPDRRARVVTGLLSGWHAPGASHLELLQAVAGSALVQRAYAAALCERYRWHEFGDSCLLLP